MPYNNDFKIDCHNCGDEPDSLYYDDKDKHWYCKKCYETINSETEDPKIEKREVEYAGK